MLCQNCERKEARAGGECATCYTYRRRNGEPRPARLYTRPHRNEYEGLTTCRTCGQARTAKGRLIRIRGECSACYLYRQTHGGQPRPARLYNFPRQYEYKGLTESKTAPVVCDCGRPATHWPEVTLGAPNGSFNKHEVLPLCDGCYQKFLEVEAA